MAIPTNAPQSPFTAYDSAAPVALVIAEGAEQRNAAVERLESSGVYARGAVSFAEAADDRDAFDGLDLVVIEAVGAPEAFLELVMIRTDAVARERRLGVIATIQHEQIDLAAAALSGPGRHLLCDPTEMERAAALALARAERTGGRLNDVTRDPSSAQLQRLNEEIARIADTLARLARDEPVPRGGVRDPGRDFRAPDDAEPLPVSAQDIRQVIRARRLRAQFFDGELFADPAWDMLLDLLAAHLEKGRVSVSSLCIAAAVPPTTALRWIGTLHEVGLFERQADATDRRRAYIALSPKALAGMGGYIRAVKRAGLGLA